MLRLSQDFGHAVRIGGFGYLGKEVAEASPMANSMWLAGGDATLSLAPFELNLQYVERRDSNPNFAVLLPFEKLRTRGAFAELIYRPKGDDGRWYGVGMFNWAESDQVDLNYTSATLHAGHLLRRNLRATAEATYVFRGPYEKHLRLGVGLITAF
jgi:hypothetical protein